MRRLMVTVIALLALFSLIRAYTDERDMQEQQQKVSVLEMTAGTR